MKINTPNPVVKASEGRQFQFGGTSVYVGPRDTNEHGRPSRRLPVLAFSRPGDKTPTVVSEFPSSSAAEKFMTALMVGVDEMTGAAAAAGLIESDGWGTELSPDTVLELGGRLRQTPLDSTLATIVGFPDTARDFDIVLSVKWFTDPHDDTPWDEIPVEELLIAPTKINRWRYAPPLPGGPR